jgi:hypothetical protein
MKSKFALLLACLIGTSIAHAGAPDKSFRIWPSIPFVRGADLCAYKNAYDSTRSEYMNKMVSLASELMYMGSYGSEAAAMLKNFNDLYDQNRRIGTNGLGSGLDVTLENTFKAYLDQVYRQTHPRTKKLVFFNPGEASAALNGGRNIEDLGYIMHGTYSYAPNCAGDILVTLSVMNRNSEIETFQANGSPQNVMGYLAEEVFKHYQKTQFPSTINNGGKALTIVGALNGDVAQVVGTRAAVAACDSLQARLPTEQEYMILEAYGAWDGGLDLGRTPWAMDRGYVFHPVMRNPSPVFPETNLNDKTFNYVCVRNVSQDDPPVPSRKK